MGISDLLILVRIPILISTPIFLSYHRVSYHKWRRFPDHLIRSRTRATSSKRNLEWEFNINIIWKRAKSKIRKIDKNTNTKISTQKSGGAPLPQGNPRAPSC